MGSFISKPKAQVFVVPRSPSPANVVEVEQNSENENLTTLPSDLALIVSQGLDVDPTNKDDALKQTIADLRAKYDFVQPPSTDSVQQEARLRALLKGKRKAAQNVKEVETSEDSDTSSSSSEDEKPVKKARIQESDEEGEDDEEGGIFKSNPATANEEVEPPIQKPPFESLPPDAGGLSVLGTVQSIVSKTIVVKAAASGADSVLDTGSIVCLADRRCLGCIAETFGPVQAPCYLIRFESSDDPLLRLVTKTTTLYYPSNPHFTHILNTLQVKAMSKPSDASNLHDEEVAGNEMDFSDDEQEAAYKRMLKEHRQGSPRVPDYSATSQKKERGQPSQRIDGDLEYTPLQRPGSSSIQQQQKATGSSSPAQTAALPRLQTSTLPPVPSQSFTSVPTGPSALMSSSSKGVYEKKGRGAYVKQRGGTHVNGKERDNRQHSNMGQASSTERGRGRGKRNNNRARGGRGGSTSLLPPVAATGHQTVFTGRMQDVNMDMSTIPARSSTESYQPYSTNSTGQPFQAYPMPSSSTMYQQDDGYDPTSPSTISTAHYGRSPQSQAFPARPINSYSAATNLSYDIGTPSQPYGAYPTQPSWQQPILAQPMQWPQPSGYSPVSPNLPPKVYPPPQGYDGYEGYEGYDDIHDSHQLQR